MCGACSVVHVYELNSDIGFRREFKYCGQAAV
jgi:hypothetical protein